MKAYLIAGTFGLVLAAPALQAQEAFGGAEDTAYAQSLWQVMEDLRLAGDGMIMGTPYEGTDPHGMMLETFYTSASIEGHEGDLIVKRNYGPQGVTADQVLSAPGEHLGSLTVMFRREGGYDSDNANWFWAKYLPDGTLDKTPNDMQMAGRIAKGADQGCIACHSGEADYVFTSDHLSQ